MLDHEPQANVLLAPELSWGGGGEGKPSPFS